MKNSKANLIFWTIATIIILPSIIMMTRYERKEGIAIFKQFDSTEINSRLEVVDIKYHGSHIRLSDGREFIFYPYSDEEKGTIFNYTACKGDSIVKRACSDTLYLIKKDIKYAYTFDIDFRKK